MWTEKRHHEEDLHGSEKQTVESVLHQVQEKTENQRAQCHGRCWSTEE